MLAGVPDPQLHRPVSHTQSGIVLHGFSLPALPVPHRVEKLKGYLLTYAFEMSLEKF